MRRVLGVVVTVAIATAAWIAPVEPALAAGSGASVLGPATLDAPSLARAVTAIAPRPRLDLPVVELATLFLEEGAAEGVRADVAFAQAVLETNWFRFTGAVPPGQHNYAGIGAYGGVVGRAFPAPRLGVRAQIQALKAYADPSVREADLRHPMASPGWRNVRRGSAPTWQALGGRWASDRTYGERVLAVYARISRFTGIEPALEGGAAQAATAPRRAARPAAACAPPAVSADGQVCVLARLLAPNLRRGTSARGALYLRSRLDLPLVLGPGCALHLTLDGAALPCLHPGRTLPARAAAGLPFEVPTAGLTPGIHRLGVVLLTPGRPATAATLVVVITP